MNTSQIPILDNAVANPVTPPGAFYLMITSSITAELVYSALRAKRQGLIEQATHQFAAHYSDEYLISRELIDGFDSLIDDMFLSMNRALDQVSNGKYVELRERDRLEKFGQDKKQVLDNMNRIHREAFGE